MLKSIRLLILAALCVLVPALPHAAVAQASTDYSAEEAAEYNDITDALVMPAADDMSKAVALIQSDPAQACKYVNAARTKSAEAARRLRSLADRRKAAGKDNSELTPMIGKLDNMAAQADKMSPAVCNGQAPSSDPETQAFLEKLSGHLALFVQAAQDARAAREANDMPRFCQRTRDALKTLDDLDALAAEGRLMVRAKGQSEAQFDSFAQQMREARTALMGAMTDCPAA